MVAERQDERIESREAELAGRDARIAEQAERIAVLDARVAELTALVAELREKLGQNSGNSHLPPSSDGPGGREKSGPAKRKKSKRKRGGQRGHRGSHRELLPPDQVDETVDFFPENCACCDCKLDPVKDPRAKRYQRTELPPIRPHTTEFLRHQVECSRCGHKTRAAYEGNIPKSAFGPRLTALMSLLTGVYHLSRRRTQLLLNDVLGVKVALGALSAAEERVSNAVAPAVDEVWEHARQADVKHTDGTGWVQSGRTMALWTIATTAVTVFRIVSDGSKATLKSLFGALKGILVSDRATALNFWVMKLRQICWAHLLRKFVSFSERDGPAGQLGHELLGYTGLVFEYWHDYGGGKLSRERYLAWMAPVQRQLEALLLRGVRLDIKGVSGSCANILTHKDALWTFIERDDVEPTNNHAERELRAFVLWRKKSFGTQSARGNRFAERMMTIAHTARKQEKNVLTFLTACCGSSAKSGCPSLLADAA